MEQLYALYYERDDQVNFFYVGRTERAPKKRLQEHRSRAKSGTEDVYKFIREHLQPNGIDVWDMQVLVNEAGDPVDDCEDFWIVEMIRAGHDLKNMKHGDLRKIALLQGVASESTRFDTVREFVRVRDDYERSERLKREVLGEAVGDPVLMAMIQQNTERFREQNAAAHQRLLKREARARANAREKEAWLKSLRNGKTDN
jgi:hypothetical protein